MVQALLGDGADPSQDEKQPGHPGPGAARHGEASRGVHGARDAKGDERAHELLRGLDLDPGQQEHRRRRESYPKGLVPGSSPQAGEAVVENLDKGPKGIRVLPQLGADVPAEEPSHQPAPEDLVKREQGPQGVENYHGCEEAPVYVKQGGSQMGSQRGRRGWGYFVTTGAEVRIMLHQSGTDIECQIGHHRPSEPGEEQLSSADGTRNASPGPERDCLDLDQLS